MKKLMMEKLDWDLVKSHDRAIKELYRDLMDVVAKTPETGLLPYSQICILIYDFKTAQYDRKASDISERLLTNEKKLDLFLWLKDIFHKNIAFLQPYQFPLALGIISSVSVDDNNKYVTNEHLIVSIETALWYKVEIYDILKTTKTLIDGSIRPAFALNFNENHTNAHKLTQERRLFSHIVRNHNADN